MVFNNVREAAKTLFKKSAVLSRYVHQNLTKQKFETVFAFPLIKYVAVYNRLKVYQYIGSALAVAISGPLEATQNLSSGSTAAAAYIGLTGSILLSLSSLSTKDMIGFIYVSEDNEYIKISSVDYWGKRIDSIIHYEDWTPLSEQPSKPTDIIYMSIKVPDRKKPLKLPTRFGKIINESKMNAVIE